MKKEEELTYTRAFNELEEIVSQMEDSQIPVDELDEKISRAAYLLRICKDKLYKTEKNVQKVLDEISRYAGEGESASPASGDSP